MQKENKNKVFNYYKKVTVKIALKLFRNMIENGGDDMMTMEELEDKSADLINKFTESFMENDFSLEDIKDTDLEANKNVVRNYLLNLASTTSLIPEEDLVGYCCKECVSLIYYTNEFKED